MDSATINSIGLVLDIIGVILLFLYVLPNYVNQAGEVNALKEIACSGPTPEGMKLWKRHRWLSFVGLALLIGGFALQIASNYLGVKAR